MKALLPFSMQPGDHNLMDTCRFPLIWIGVLCEKLRPLALSREGAPKLQFLSGLSTATEAMHKVILLPLIKSPYWTLWSIFCNFDLRPSYQLRFSWLFRLIVRSSAENWVGGRSKWTQFPPSQLPSSNAYLYILIHILFLIFFSFQKIEI